MFASVTLFSERGLVSPTTRLCAEPISRIVTRDEREASTSWSFYRSCRPRAQRQTGDTAEVAPEPACSALPDDMTEGLCQMERLLEISHLHEEAFGIAIVSTRQHLAATALSRSKDRLRS